MHTGQPFRLPARSEVCDASGVLKSGRCPRLVGVEDQIERGQRALCLSKVSASQRVDRGRDPLLAQQHPYVVVVVHWRRQRAQVRVINGTSPSQSGLAQALGGRDFVYFAKQLDRVGCRLGLCRENISRIFISDLYSHSVTHEVMYRHMIYILLSLH